MIFYGSALNAAIVFQTFKSGVLCTSCHAKVAMAPLMDASRRSVSERLARMTQEHNKTDR